MAYAKVVTVIANRSGQVLILKVSNQSCFVKLATIGVGGEHKMEVDVNWTYQEFSLEPLKSGSDVVVKRILVNSDDCCDFERITVTESGGKLQVCKAPRGQAPLVGTWKSFFFTWPKLINWRTFWFRP